MPTKTFILIARLLAACTLFCALPVVLMGQPVPVDSSDVISAGGETPGIFYYRYIYTGQTTVDKAVQVFHFTIRDGGASAPDSDPFPTVLDSLVVHVRLVGSHSRSIFPKQSISWAGLYTVEANPRLIASGNVQDSALVFLALAGPQMTAPDNSTLDLALYMQFPFWANVGDQYEFSIRPGDAFAREPNNATSGFGNFAVAASDTSGNLNQLLTVPKKLRIGSLNSTLMPDTPFRAEIFFIDSLSQRVFSPAGVVTVSMQSEFGTLGGTTTVTATGDQFIFTDLIYPYRNDRAELSFSSPGFDTLTAKVQFTGGGPEIPTVSNIISDTRDTALQVDGTNILLRFFQGVTAGSLLTERFDAMPNLVGPMPPGANLIASRYVRLTPGRTLQFPEGYQVGIPVSGLTKIGDPYGLLMLYRPDNSSPWTMSLSSTIGNQNDHLFGRFKSFGEIGLSANLDQALPLELVEFTASNGPEGVLLKWRTASEIDNAGYVIRRATSPDGEYVTVSDYQFNQELRGHGTTPFGASYNWIDKDLQLVEGSLYYYKLYDVSLDGAVNEYGPRIIEFTRSSAVDTDTSVASYPNPFDDHTTLSFMAAEPGRAEIVISNALGKRVLTTGEDIDREGSRAIPIDGSTLPSGMYLYEIRMGSRIARGIITKISR